MKYTRWHWSHSKVVVVDNLDNLDHLGSQIVYHLLTTSSSPKPLQIFMTAAHACRRAWRTSGLQGPYQRNHQHVITRSLTVIGQLGRQDAVIFFSAQEFPPGLAKMVFFTPRNGRIFVYNIYLISISDTVSDGAKKRSSSPEYWKGTAQLTDPRNLSPICLIIFVRRGFNNSKCYKKRMGSLALFPPRNFAVFERKLPLEYYTQVIC